MNSQQENSGFLLVRKPCGLSSFQVVKKVRYLSKVKKVGHAGTLDPFASGLLILGLGKANTRKLDYFQALPKTYQGVFVLGITTDTYDAYGVVTNKKPVNQMQSLEKKLAGCIETFKGKISQKAPIYSAKKHAGVSGYKLARKGLDVPQKESEVQIYELKIKIIKNTAFPMFQLFVKCSKGTYIRSLVHDIGECLETGAYLKDLQRIAIGDYKLENAVNYFDLAYNTIVENLMRNLKCQ